MGVATEIIQDLLRTAEGTLAIGHPLFAIEFADQWLEWRIKCQLAFSIRLLQMMQEFLLEQVGNHIRVDKELFAPF